MSKKDSDLFTPVVKERLHDAFRQLLESPFHWAARDLMNDLFRRMGDPDGNFVRDFQTDGFHSRMFEIACYAYLEAQGLEIERSDRPDFVVARDGQRVALEATTTNPRSGRATDISLRKVEPLSAAAILEKCSNEFPIRMGSALRSKLEKKYWELPSCAGIPFVLIVGPFHEAGSTTYVDDSLARYLYGTETFDDWTERNGVLVRGDVPVRAHEFGGKSIPSNFFGEQGAENISAVIYCNQLTVPRFYRMAAQAGIAPANVTDVRTGYCLLPGEGTLEYQYVVGEDGTPVETWWQGVTIPAQSSGGASPPGPVPGLHL